MNTRTLTLLLVVLMTLTGCASMSSEECAFSDWQAVGYQDGAQGSTSDVFGKYQEACTKHGITPDFQAWQAGRSVGLEEYCQPSRGFTLGERGGRYNGVCPSSHEPEFLDAYRTGSQLYSLRANLNSAQSRLNSNAHAIEQLEKGIIEKTALAIADGTPREQRVLLLAEVADMAVEKGEREGQIDALIAQRTEAEIALREYEASIVAFRY